MDGRLRTVLGTWRRAGEDALTPAVLALLGTICLLALAGLGVLARTRLVTRHDLHVDRRVAGLRFPAGTDAALGLTAAASEAVGIGVLLVGVLWLVLRQRRRDAVRLALAVGGAWALGVGTKVLIERHRPPATLQLLAPDSAGSFPSGHDTTACTMILVAFVVLRGSGRARVLACSSAAASAVAVAVDRPAP